MAGSENGKQSGETTKKRSWKKKIKKALGKQLALRTWVFLLIILITSVGILIPFAAQVVLPIALQFYAHSGEAAGEGMTALVLDISALEQWNQFVSIVLGVVATLLGIVSLHMNFISQSESAREAKYLIKNLEKSKQILAYLTDKFSEKDLSTVEHHQATANRKDWEPEPTQPRPPARRIGAEQSTEPEQPAGTEQPVVPEESVEVEQFTATGQPAIPEQPVGTEQSVVAEQSVEVEQPTATGQPAIPEQPIDSGRSATIGQPIGPAG